MINPLVIVNPNDCPHCKKGNVAIIESEVNAILLDKDGKACVERNLLYKDKCQCISCLENFEFERIGDREVEMKYRISTRGTRILRKYKEEQRLKGDNKNPFGHNEEGNNE